MLFLLFCQKISWYWIIVAKQWFPKWRFRKCKYNESLNISNGWNSISTSRSSGVIRRMPSVSKSMQPSPRLCPCKPLPPLRTGWAGMPSQSQVRHRRTSGGSSGDTTKHRWRCTNESLPWFLRGPRRRVQERLTTISDAEDSSVRCLFRYCENNLPQAFREQTPHPVSSQGHNGQLYFNPRGYPTKPNNWKNKSFRYTKLNNSGNILLNIK